MSDAEPRSPDPHLLGRLESFSDLVFGFVVPTMAINLKVPSRPEDLVHGRKDLFLFAAGFLFLCFLWLRHHRTMRRFFVPDVFGTFLVFAILGTVALYGYPFQLYLHFPNDPVALRAYGWGYAWLSLVYAVLVAYALRRLGSTWTPERAREARRALVANSLIAGVMAIFPFVQEPGPFLVVLVVFGAALRLSKRWVAVGSLGR